MLSTWTPKYTEFFEVNNNYGYDELVSQNVCPLALSTLRCKAMHPATWLRRFAERVERPVKWLRELISGSKGLRGKGCRCSQQRQPTLYPKLCKSKAKHLMLQICMTLCNTHQYQSTSYTTQPSDIRTLTAQPRTLETATALLIVHLRQMSNLSHSQDVPLVTHGCTHPKLGIVLGDKFYSTIRWSNNIGYSCCAWPVWEYHAWSLRKVCSIMQGTIIPSRLMSGLRAEGLVSASRAGKGKQTITNNPNSKTYTLDLSHAKTIHNLCIETNNLPRGTAGLQKPRVQVKWQSNETLIGISTLTPTRAKCMWYDMT